MTNSERKRRSRRLRKAAEHMAYEHWRYVRPNEEAVDRAALHIRRAMDSLEAVGMEVVIPEEPRHPLRW